MPHTRRGKPESARTQGDVKDSSERDINEYWRFQRQGDEWLLRGISQTDEAIDDEVSIDAETIAERSEEGVEFNAAVNKAEAEERGSQSRYQTIALIVGFGTALAGYLVYFLAFREFLRLFFD